MKKVISLVVVFTMILSFVTFVYADDPGISQLTGAMSGVSTMASTSSKVGTVINNVIGLIQMVGSGIALIVITMLGIKYILASPGEKADVKKQIMPILIGCVLLFGAVNLMAAVAEFAKVI